MDKRYLGLFLTGLKRIHWIGKQKADVDDADPTIPNNFCYLLAKKPGYYG